MPAVIFLAFLAVPIVEIAILIEVGGRIGVWPTIGLVIATAVFGTWMLRIQGLSTLRRAQESLARNAFPAREVFDGLCLVFAGALLLTPGFATDTIGLLLLLPPVRAALRTWLTGWLVAHGRIYTTGMGPNPPDGPPDGPPGGPPGEGPIIDGEFEEIDPDRKPESRKDGKSSPWIPPSGR